MSSRLVVSGLAELLLEFFGALGGITQNLDDIPYKGMHDPRISADAVQKWAGPGENRAPNP